MAKAYAPKQESQVLVPFALGHLSLLLCLTSTPWSTLPHRLEEMQSFLVPGKLPQLHSGYSRHSLATRI